MISFATILKLKMSAFIKSTNIINNAINGFLDPKYVGIATEIKCIGRLEAEIYCKKHVLIAAIMRKPRWPPNRN
jgi:hypothetical protein